MFSRSAWTTLLSATTLALAATIPVKRATVCNGHAELCNRSYGNITYVGSHDSAFFSQDPLALARDQEAQSHVNNGVLHFCHTSCSLFDGGPVVDYLKTVKTFMDANPNEVLTFIFTNPEGQSPTTVWKPLFDEAGLTNLSYVPPSIPVKQSDWPTLGSMIDSGKRLVVFMDAGADGADAVDFIMPEFQMVWEAPFSSTDPTFPCRVDRVAGPLANEDHMFMINHNLNKNIISLGSTDVLVSDPVDAPTTNGVTSILADANGCAPLGGNRAPNFVLLDYVNIGDGFTVAAQLNGLPPPAPAPAPAPTDAAGAVASVAASAGNAIESGISSLGNAIKGLF
ncbi:PLC-like phosphodiesterase [Mycena metata]|uniref:PLC-like phosphodiesterase n=1 Tax=Mycena metata TaxID=1033252 RepID=A0AAD7JHP0_9AGAR|nr:PLC-like phosphodiesterase [Mycena metata]